MSLNCWAPSHDTCLADCKVTWALDDETRASVWEMFANAPQPVGYDPAMIPAWGSPTSPSFAALRLEPFRLRVYPGTMLLRREGRVLTWKAVEPLDAKGTGA